MVALIRLENRGGGPDSTKFPVNFPVSQGSSAETGSQLTACSGWQDSNSGIKPHRACLIGGFKSSEPPGECWNTGSLALACTRFE